MIVALPGLFSYLFFEFRIKSHSMLKYNKSKIYFLLSSTHFSKILWYIHDPSPMRIICLVFRLLLKFVLCFHRTPTSNTLCLYVTVNKLNEIHSDSCYETSVSISYHRNNFHTNSTCSMIVFPYRRHPLFPGFAT